MTRRQTLLWPREDAGTYDFCTKSDDSHAIGAENWLLKSRKGLPTEVGQGVQVLLSNRPWAAVCR